MISHEDASQLLGAYALDAVDGAELTELEEHLATCPRCRAELDGLREAAGALGNSVEPLPEELWSRISDRLGDSSGAGEEPPPMPELTVGAPKRSPFRAQSTGRTRRTRSNALLLGAVAVAASAVAIVLGIGLVRSQDNVTNLQQSIARERATAQQTPAEVALHTPGHQVVNLMNSAHVELVVAIDRDPGAAREVQCNSIVDEFRNIYLFRNTTASRVTLLGNDNLANMLDVRRDALHLRH